MSQGLYRVRPISDRTMLHGKPGPNRALFQRGSWADTLNVMARELDAADARDVVLELDVAERMIRADGELRADASTASTSPAVRLTFTTSAGPIAYATDLFGWDYYDRPLAQGWQQNVRAIVKGMEALRRVERYGIAQNGEQYRGYLQIESGITTTGLDPSIALQIIADESTWPEAAVQADLDAAIRQAKRKAHPDRHNGDDSRWHAVQRAAETLTEGTTP